MKKILFLLLMAFSLTTNAQFEHSKKVELKVVDELPTALTSTKVLVTDPITGEIKYIPLSTVQASVVAPITGASNGLSSNGLNIELGGGLFKDTEIDLNGNNLALVNVLEDLTANDVLVLTASGEIKSIPKSSISQDLSGYVTIDLDEVVTGKKTFIKDDSSGGLNNYNNSIGIFSNNINFSSGTFNIEQNSSTGIFNIKRNESAGFFDVNRNESTGVFTQYQNTFDSSGDTFMVGKQSLLGGLYDEVFKIDNVGNTTTQKLTAKVIDEDLTADKVLVTDATGEIKSIPKSAIEPDLSNYVTIDTDEVIESRKTFNNTATEQAGITINTDNTGFDLENAGLKVVADNVSVGAYFKNVEGYFNFHNFVNGRGFYFENQSTVVPLVDFAHIPSFGNNIKMRSNSNTGTNLLLETFGTGNNLYLRGQSRNQLTIDRGGSENSIKVIKDAFGNILLAEEYGSNNELFKIGNDGTLTLPTVAEDLTSTEILARNTADEVVKMPISNITEGYLPLTGGTLTGNLTIDKGASSPLLYFNRTGFDSRFLTIGSNGDFVIFNTNKSTNDMRITEGGNAMFGGVTSSGGGFKVGANEVLHEGNVSKWVLYGNTSATAQSISANTETVLINNGGYNNNSNLTKLYDTTTQQLDLSEAKQKDNLSIVMEVEVETLSNSQVVYLKYRGAIGSANEWTINLTNEVYYKSQGVRKMVCKFDVPLEFVEDITNPAEISIVSDGNINATTKYHYLKIN